jgi:hypothetical protein
MTTLWLFLFSFWAVLPWVFIGLMAALALRRQPDNRYLMLQAVGASSMFVLAMAQWVIDALFGYFQMSTTIRNPTNYIFGFLLFMALATFAAGYCLERFKRRSSAGPVQVTATPVNR